MAREIISDGIWLTRPSPMVSIAYLLSASVAVSPPRIIPMTTPPTKLITVIIRPAVASPFTYLVAPSMEPKNDDSSCIFSRRSFACWSVIAPVFKSASIAICLPGIASSVNLAVTSDTRSEPLLITRNWTIINMIKTIMPTTGSPLPTNSPNWVTTAPGSPVVRISFVDDTFRDMRNVVVKSRMVGNVDIFSTSWEKSALNRIIMAIEMFNAKSTSSRLDLIGTIKNTIAARI